MQPLQAEAGAREHDACLLPVHLQELARQARQAAQQSAALALQAAQAALAPLAAAQAALALVAALMALQAQVQSSNGAREPPGQSTPWALREAAYLRVPPAWAPSLPRLHRRRERAGLAWRRCWQLWSVETLEWLQQLPAPHEQLALQNRASLDRHWLIVVTPRQRA